MKHDPYDFADERYRDQTLGQRADARDAEKAATNSAADLINFSKSLGLTPTEMRLAGLIAKETIQAAKGNLVALSLAGVKDPHAVNRAALALALKSLMCSQSIIDEALKENPL